MADWARRYTWELLLAVILLGTIVFNVAESSGYLGVDNFVNMFQLHIEKVIVVVTMTFVIVSGEIDLSVASVMAWSASVLAALHEHEVPLVVAILVALIAAAGAGLIHGLCVARLGLPSLVVTLAGLIGWRGAARHPRRGPFDRRLPGVVRPSRPGQHPRPAPALTHRVLRPDRRRMGDPAPNAPPAACCT